ncbi:unnamed protein product [Rotaria sordida]|uniref:TTF-type domain-containing protein n=1 Tax=Rotaria sordida TaxID=392033 RepID=A0A814D113_9BILA|nr:unnamed protein product [Rotaria sordida]CAF0981516.1 unnamed protein product [Rotaria sordida]
MKKRHITTLQWPANLTDLNLIESIWLIVDKKMLKYSFENVDDLKIAMTTTWNDISTDVIQKLYKSMRNNLKEVIKRKEVNEVEIQSNSVEETEDLRIKRFKSDELADSTTLTTNNTTTASIISSTTTLSTISSLSNERDPCHGPAKAKDHILLGPFQSKTKFPTVNGRHFRAEWYNTYPWLEYSLELNHAFCFPCRLRNERKHETAFTATSFNQWKNGTLRLNDHQAANCHKESFERWKKTLQNYNNNTDVLKLLNQQYSKQATENRAYLKEIIRTVHFLARQGVSCKL